MHVIFTCRGISACGIAANAGGILDKAAAEKFDGKAKGESVS